MAIDTAAKQMSMLNFGDGRTAIVLPIPDGAYDSADRQHLLDCYSGIAFAAAAATAIITGTAGDGITEAEVVAGGETIIITLANDTWVAAGAAFDAQRQAIIDGLDSDGVEATGWNAEVRDKEVVGAVVRTSDAVVTITLSAAAAYDVVANETITVTVPATAVAGAQAIIATPTFAVTAAPVVTPFEGLRRHTGRLMH